MPIWGARPEEAAGGEAALKLLHEAREAGDPYRLAVLDMQMPGMGGEELARAVRSDAGLRDTQLVMLTSLGQRGDAERFKEIGFEAYLMKPIRQSELFDSLAAVLSGATDRDEANGSSKGIVTRHSIRELNRDKVRILVAEDNIVNQKVALGILKKMGVSAEAVANGEEAVQSLQSIPYDLVLMDIQMPEMDGFEATETIRDRRSDVQNHDVPVIAMTANAMTGDRERCLEAGMNDYVSKPVKPEELSEVLEKWLSGEGGKQHS